MQQLNNLKKSLRNLVLLSMVVSKLEVARSVDITVCIFKLSKHFLRQAYELYYIFGFLQHGFCFGFVEFEELSSMHSALEVQSNFELLIL